MWRDVLSRNIADKLLESEWIGIKHQAGLSALPTDSESSGSQKQAEFKGHIEPRQPVFVQFDPRNVVDAPAAGPDQRGDFVDPGLARVVNFKRGAQDKATHEDNKHDGVGQGPIRLVERAVDEYTTLVISISLGLRSASVRCHFPPRAGR